MANFETAFEEVKKLVLDFQQNESLFLSPNYTESQIRIDFINKFFTALGWDVDHNIQKNPYEQEVQVETKVHVAHSQKRADYSFYIQPNFRDVKFFVEAKKPSKNLSNANDYFQTCRYGWNAGTQIVFLTDFEEFHILDCRTKPAIDTILNCKIKDYHYSDYQDREKFSEIFWLINRDAVADHSIEKFADKLPKPRGKAIRKGLHRGDFLSIDEAFLEELDEIRNELAKAFKKNNSHLESEQLTEMTQRTIDRLVFIRFLEDKQIEPDHIIDGLLREVGTNSASTVWQKFIRAGRTLDAKYNGIVFKKHFIDSNDFHEPDDKTFTSICEELAHVNSPYNFDIIPIHILGSIYERFLGKVVIATDKRARIEEKPEVRKAGGVYYTPQYIVNYIVDNTVGKLIEGKTPKEISKMRFADISCGSGSFLITVFDRLLEYHRKWYQNNSEQAKKDGCILSDGRWVLSLKQKQNILTNNIYGVDLDHQAVEVTQLSLYLKLLEDETTATTHETWVMFKEQLLPNLNNNIVCGNSLIGTDILDLTLFPSPTLEERQRERFDELKLKPMNFEDVFPEIMSNGGFDAIVGNPPYIPIESFSENEKKYYQNKFPEFKRKYDSSVVFISKALSLLNEQGLLSYISSQTWETGENYSEFRKKVFLNYGCFELINLPYNIFKDAYVDTGIFIFSKAKQKSYRFYSYSKKKKIDAIQNLQFELIDCSYIKEPDYKLVFSKNVNQVLRKFSASDFISLGEITISTQGLSASKFKETTNLNDKWTLPFYNASVKRYSFSIDSSYYVNLKNMKSLFQFYEEKDKILIRRIINRQDRLDAVYFNKAGVFKKDLNPFILNNAEFDIRYIIALINSRLFSWIYLNSSSIATKDDFRQTTLAELRKLPIRKISEKQKNIHDKLVHLVNQVLESKKQLAAAKTESEKEYLEKKCNSIDRQIDQLVYELYGLTEEEIKIVEGAK
ncbi:MAG: N-6 DNA methylase [Bacteroidetes bacterium]|nr:N-6 DNA methylase [Bacteroidota bacterium]MBU2586033.1 N-6 DNA methylase [Bacteroidota bacterium]